MGAHRQRLPQDRHHALPDGDDVVPRPLHHVREEDLGLPVRQLDVGRDQPVQQGAEHVQHVLPDLSVGVEEHPHQPLEQHVQDLRDAVEVPRDLVLPGLKRRVLVLHLLREHAPAGALVDARPPALLEVRDVLRGDRLRAPVLVPLPALPRLLRLLGGLDLQPRARREAGRGAVAARVARGALLAVPRVAAGVAERAGAPLLRSRSAPRRGGRSAP
mmetsp:Transcript_86269/g.244515  ORF Transcript_86269/g.244515 Transcript_86269/m.244515 type:complete len:216 (-) Transcript_86269:368-1015(-)